jgi:hypothetical protein
MFVVEEQKVGCMRIRYLGPFFVKIGLLLLSLLYTLARNVI